MVHEVESSPDVANSALKPPRSINQTSGPQNQPVSLPAAVCRRADGGLPTDQMTCLPLSHWLAKTAVFQHVVKPDVRALGLLG